jgi:two-component system, OmpR family, sensor histidine kinase KdpD
MRHGEGSGVVSDHEDGHGRDHGRPADGDGAGGRATRDDPARAHDARRDDKADGAGTDRVPESNGDRPGTGQRESGRDQVRADERDGDDTPPLGGGR